MVSICPTTFLGTVIRLLAEVPLVEGAADVVAFFFGLSSREFRLSVPDCDLGTGWLGSDNGS